MPNQDEITKASEEIAMLVDKARVELITTLYNIGLQVTDVDVFIDSLLAMDIEGTLKSKLQKATSVYADAHRNVLNSTNMFVPIDSKRLVSFAQLNEELFDSAIIKTISGHIKTSAARGLQTGLSVKEVIQGLLDSSVSNRQMETLINTSLNTYSRMTIKQMMDNAPKETLYNYIGPADGRTRPECLQMINAGRRTQAEIENTFGRSVLDVGGGFNCRHQWEEAPIEQSAFHETKEAEKLLAELNKGKS